MSLRLRFAILVWLSLLFFSTATTAEVFNAKVIVVMDGDTILVLRDGRKIKIRLANIDAPEKDQPFGNESRESLLELVGKKEVSVETKAVDRYGRIVAVVSINGHNINLEQVRRGMAWGTSAEHKIYRAAPAEKLPSRYKQSDHSKISFAEVQHQAQTKRRGLWSQSDPIHPRDWRVLHPPIHSLSATTRSRPLQQSLDSSAATGCGKKRYCTQMTSCEEARFYLKNCGLQALDGNGDGIPCASLCGHKNQAPTVADNLAQEQPQR